MFLHLFILLIEHPLFFSPRKLILVSLLRSPYHSHLNFFRFLCYISTLLSHLMKLSPRVIKSAFLGYPPSYKAYELLITVNNEIYISRYIIFHENLFSFQYESSLFIHFDFFSDTVLKT